MIVSLIIIVISTALFLYWFRYTCLLILSAKTSRDYSGAVARANELSFPQVQSAIANEHTELDALEQLLARDYRRIRRLFDLTLPKNEGFDLETAMLAVDFFGMKVLYNLSRRLRRSTARGALAEMSQIVAHLANSVGERTQLAS